MIRIIPALPLILCCVSGQESNPSSTPDGGAPAMIESLRHAIKPPLVPVEMKH